ncbi:CHAT domain-containing protein [Anabaena sp. CCY 9402-a]|uniref:CHAT domain-containing protein n=1 Tax=Anabaena sp. CCY 9402-a TaxID=3103867 RepID=UPI0039C67DB3
MSRLTPLPMNEQRQQAYLNLIRSLLESPSGEQAEILAANQELLDAGFVQKVEEVAQMCSQHGDEKTANWLRNLVMELREAMNLDNEVDLQSLSEEEKQAYFQFLMEVLQATADSSGNPQVVYPLLAENTDKLDGVLAEILRRWGTNTLGETKADEAEYLAAVIVEFSNLVAQFPLGSKANKMEIAIIGYEVALTIRTREALPEDWAATQNNLANVYKERIKGDRADNIEKAIAAYTAALTVRTREALPVEWAMTQNNLGLAYIDRIGENKAENIERAIQACTYALEVKTRQTFPQQWAETRNNLGNAYSNRILGDKAENLKQAINAYTDALEFFNRQDLPLKWAEIQNNLGNAYSNRILGDKAENLEQAINHYTDALKVLTREVSPQNWAMIQNHLGIAYHYRIKEDPTKNLEQAIKAYRNALKVRTREALPQQWAATQDHLGSAYYKKILINPSENTELAIKAIKAYENALEVRTREVAPQDWAITQNNLGNVYSVKITEEPAENFEKAIAAYTAALTVRTREALPQDHAETLFSLGRTYQDVNQFDLAYSTFKSAIVTIESLREEIVSGEESKRKQAEQFNKVYSCMVEVCLPLNKITEAIEYVERSKTRNLVEQILIRDQKTIFPPDVVTQLETHRDEIATGQYQIQNGKAENPQDLAKHLQELRQQRNELQNKYLPVGYDFDFNSFQATLNENTVIIEWYILNDKILAFIVTKQRDVTVWQSQPEDLEALEKWGGQYLQNYYTQKDQWRNNLGVSLQELASILHIDEILTQIPKHCNQLILIPHLFLHLLPLHALPVNQNSESSSCVLDLFPGGVSYAPSCQLLQQVQQRKRPDFQSLFAIQNPTGDLNYTDLEVKVIQSYFNTANVLKKTEATLTAINNSDLNTYHCAHFSCHGYFNLTNASQSGLILANAAIADTATKSNSERYLTVRLGETHDLEKCLTLDKIFSLKLEKCRLVTLSACETGLIDFGNTSDEYIGLPSGFLLAGSKAVVSSLWTVSDLSTAFLMMKFYENLQIINSVSLALNQAQEWLRNLTTEEFEALLVKYDSQIAEIFAQLEEDEQIVAEEYLLQAKNRKPYTFKNPFYWAAFTATGV